MISARHTIKKINTSLLEYGSINSLQLLEFEHISENIEIKFIWLTCRKTTLIHLINHIR